jgi:hypothetical protein
MADMTRGAKLRRAVEIFVQPDDAGIAELRDLCTGDLTVWTPNMLATGLADLSEQLGYREGAFSDVSIAFDSVGVFGNTGLAEFRLSATFSGPFVVDDEVVLEPNGAQLLLGVAAVADFAGDRISAVRAYFDDATLLEQMLPD